MDLKLGQWEKTHTYERNYTCYFNIHLNNIKINSSNITPNVYWENWEPIGVGGIWESR
jgi:hypothetical protein